MITKRIRKKKVEAQINNLTNVNILALDIASVTGWAISTKEYGTWNFKTKKDESMGMKLLRFRAKLNEVKELIQFNLIVYERAAGVFKNSIIHEAKLIGVVEEWCELNKVAYRSYSATEIKKFATGKGTAGKPLVIQAAKEKLNYTGDNDNEADALWLLQLAKQDLNLSHKN